MKYEEFLTRDVALSQCGWNICASHRASSCVCDPMALTIVLRDEFSAAHRALGHLGDF